MKAIDSGRSYPKNGQMVFVFHVTGTEAELEQYKKAQGENYREDEETGHPLAFTTNYPGPECNMLITRNGKAVMDTSELDRMASLSKRFGGNMGQEIAKMAADRFVSKFMKAPSAPVQDGAKEEVKEPSPGLGGM